MHLINVAMVVVESMLQLSIYFTVFYVESCRNKLLNVADYKLAQPGNKFYYSIQTLTFESIANVAWFANALVPSNLVDALSMLGTVSFTKTGIDYCREKWYTRVILHYNVLTDGMISQRSQTQYTNCKLH